MDDRSARHHLTGSIQRFRDVYPGTEPTRLSRAPGRVNLIGEHTDYNGLPVLPMALQQEIRVLFTPRNDGTVHVANEKEEFGKRSFEISAEIPPGPPGDWSNYLRAPCQALARRFGSLGGFDALVSSTLPVASGLSSSSALVIAVGQAILEINSLTLPALEFADAMARAERYTGTQGGGMDQAISAGARKDHASRIEFEPLRMFHVPIPGDWRFVVAHTLIRAEKSGRAQEAYNLRTLECREALGHLEKQVSEIGPGVTYSDLLETICIQDLVELGEAHLDGVLLKRFRHVVTEGTRVYDAEHALRREDRLTFGLLMNSSHESLREDYQVSSPELDTLVNLALEAGAQGARLTGAGFGGCMVVLTSPDSVGQLLEALREGYFRNRLSSDPGGRDVDLDEVLFVAEASGGATVEPL